MLTACTDFVDVELPKNKLSVEDVFTNPETAEAALKNSYVKMRDDQGLASHHLGIVMGLYTDELESYDSNASNYQYQNHTLLASDLTVLNLWNSTYNQIYAANAIIEGVGNSVSLTSEEAGQFTGEALFIRAYLHLLLVELFGNIPYITITDYRKNTTVSRMSRVLVYDQIIKDLSLALDLLPDTDISGEKVRPYAAVVEAVLARAYLYTEQWTLAEAFSDRIITKFGALESDLNKVFLKDASGTIWQFKPDSDGENTSEGAFFIFTAEPLNNPVLSPVLVNAFEPDDLRQLHWIKAAHGTATWYHAFKYKEASLTETTSVEYSIQFRLAEQYLIRAEARAQLGDLLGAQKDINAIRNRAGLNDTTASTLKDLLDAILHERWVELFTEQGHRWFDLKRMGKTADVLAPIKSGWKATDILLPIPETELLLNPNLEPQNEGY
ncbi:RagB/SusD family nutrient uptake outer membrane protein [Flavivirga jejuensis]